MSDISIAPPAVFWLLFAGYIYFHLFTFNLCVSLNLKWVSSVQHIFRSWFSKIHFKKSDLFIYLFLAALGLHCCAWAFSSCGEQGLLFVAVRGLLIVVASFVAEHGL